jgi:hypothetical protein
MMTHVTFNTAGDGYWSDAAKTVTITDMQLGYVDEDELDFGELRVYFDTTTWNVNDLGLIYTDRLFIVELNEFLAAQGLPAAHYSEQGMQGDDYVSLDVDGLFLAAWAKKFKINLKDFA